ncbi:LPS-assembly protein LptD [Reinekea thalattae]|uniref:LPS-assembly protein LptD n=1 Tax=Reinekea thalattae TaxID=2593301 RepID=UPI0016509513|nr:LPS assembly protein LptD [Reinekea thalattae]
MLTSQVLLTVNAEPITQTDWKAWQSLSDDEKANVAPYCSGRFVAPVIETPEIVKGGKTYILFDQDNSDAEQNHHLTGDIKIYSEQGVANSDQAYYSVANQQSELSGNVAIRTPDNGISGSDATLSLEDYYAIINNAQFVLYQQNLHGEANQIERTQADAFNANGITFTRCAPSSDAWNIKASSLTIDSEEGLATAWNARFEVKNIPVLYTPYISFPIDDRPRTGLLTPTLGSKTTLPYYINLAPNYDDTITPVITSDNGSVLRNEFRFLTKQHSGTNQIDYQVIQADSSDDRRWSISHEQEGSIIGGIEYQFDSRWVSDINFDPAYYSGSDSVDYQTLSLDLSKSVASLNNKLAIDYSRPVDDSSEDFETYSIQLSNSNSRFSSSLLFEEQEEYEPTSDASASDYDYLRAPEFALSLTPNSTILGFDQVEKFRLGYFSRGLSDSQLNSLASNELDYATEAFRSYASLSLSRDYLASSKSYFKPKFEVFASQYSLTNDQGLDLNSEYGAEQVSQYAGRASLDIGTSYGDKHVVSPRLYYAYAPLTDQDGPILDSEEATSFALFTASRFSGYDRVGDMNRLATSLAYRYQANGNAEFFSASMSKGIQLSQERLTETGVDSIDEDWQPVWSDWFATLGYQPNSQWTFSADAALEHDAETFSSYGLTAHYKPTDKVFGYFEAEREEDDDEDSDDYGTTFDYLKAGAYFPVRYNVALIGYASFEKEAQESPNAYQFNDILYGLEYDNCCWNVRLAALESAADDDDSDSFYPEETEWEFYFELTLKGINSGSGNIESILNSLDFGYAGRLFNYQ